MLFGEGIAYVHSIYKKYSSKLPELDIIFDDIRFDQNEREGYYQIDSIEGQWNRGSKTESPNLGYKVPYQGGYYAVPPTDHHMDIRNEMMRTMIKCGLDVECQHHEVGTAGQGEIDLRYQSITEMADQMMIEIGFRNSILLVLAEQAPS